MLGRGYVESEAARHEAVVSRLAEVHEQELCWDPAVTSAANVATLQSEALNQLAVAGIVAR